MTKNGQNLNVYGKLKDEERMEAKIPKEGYNPYANNENNNRKVLTCSLSLSPISFRLFKYIS